MWRRRRLCAQSRRCLPLSTRRAVARRPRGVGRVPRLRPGSRAGPGLAGVRSVRPLVDVGLSPLLPWRAVPCGTVCVDNCPGSGPGTETGSDRRGAGSLLGEESVWGPDAGRRRPPRRVGPCAAANVYFTSRDFHLHEKQQQLVPVMPRGASRTLGTTATKLPGPGAAGGGWPCASRPEPGTELKSAAPRAGLGAEDGCPRPLFKLLDSEDLLISSEIVANFVSYFV